MQLPHLQVTWLRWMPSKRFLQTLQRSKSMQPRYFSIPYVTGCDDILFNHIDKRLVCLLTLLYLSPVYDRALPWSSWGARSHCHNQSNKYWLAAPFYKPICKHMTLIFIVFLSIYLLPFFFCYYWCTENRLDKKGNYFFLSWIENISRVFIHKSK